MSFKDALIGAKGGGGSYRNVPDSLRSTDTYEALIGLGTSRMKLAPGGLQNLFVDDVAVEDGQGQTVFKDFSAVLFDGNPMVLEPVKLHLGASSGANAVNLALANAYTNGAKGDWVTAAVTQPNVDFIDIRLIVQQLYAQTKKGNGEQTATIEIEMRPSGSSQWVNPLLDVSAPTYNSNGIAVDNRRIFVLARAISQITNKWVDATPGQLRIRGKTTSPYVKELRVVVPNTGAYANKTWQVRCRLVERDYVVSGPDGENEDRRSISWESVAGIVTQQLGGVEAWRGLSYVQVYGKATDQISSVPEITGIYDIGEFPVPPNGVWNPTTRAYSGSAWDGVTYQMAWTQCPAFQIKGLIEDDLSGVSALAPGSTMNKWDVLEASKWFAQLVPDGRGGTHPRYSANWFLEQGMQVHELANYLAGAVGALCWDEGDGQWRMRVEKPEPAVAIFTKENIVGEFVYSHTDFDSRFNDYTGVFRNKDNRYEEDRVRVFDQANIDDTGRRHTTIALVGCDNRQEALRRCKIRLLTSLHETRIINFTTNRQGALLEQFSVIGIADGDLLSDTAMRSTGRIVAIDANRTRITLRDTLRLEPGVAYSVQITIPNTDYDPEISYEPTSSSWRKPTVTLTTNVVNSAGQRGDVFDLYLDQALPANIQEYAVVALSAPGLPSLPKPYRVTNVQLDEKGELATVSAVEIYTPKWTESDNVNEDEILGQVSRITVPIPLAPVGAPVLSIRNSLGTFGFRRTVLTANWRRPGGMFTSGYRVIYQLNGGPKQLLAEKTLETSIEISEPPEGDYRFEIQTVDRRGYFSKPLIAELEVTSGMIEDISTRLELIDEIASDNVLSSGEKGPFIQEITRIRSEGASLYARSGAFGINAERTTLNTALIALNDYLDTLTDPTAWNNLTGNTTIDGAVLRQKVVAYYNAAVALNDKMILVASERATWQNVRDSDPNAPEDNATNGAPPGTNVGNRPVEQVLSDIDLNAQTLLAYSFDQQSLRDYVDQAIFVDGELVNAVVQQEKVEREEGDAALAQVISLIGAKTLDGTAFVLNLDTAKVDPDTTLVSKFTTLEAFNDQYIADITELREVVITNNGLIAQSFTQIDTQSAAISELRQIVEEPNGSTVAKAMLELDVNGHIVSYVATNNGTRGALTFRFDAIEMLDPDGNLLFVAENGAVRMPNVEVGRFQADTIDTETLKKFAIRRSYSVELASNWTVPYSNQLGLIAQITTSKDEADSDVQVEFYMRMRTLEYAGIFEVVCDGVVMDSIWYWAPALSDIAGNNSFRMTMPYKRRFSGLGTGTHVWKVRITHHGDNDANNAGFIETGSGFFIEEVKR